MQPCQVSCYRYACKLKKNSKAQKWFVSQSHNKNARPSLARTPPTLQNRNDFVQNSVSPLGVDNCFYMIAKVWGRYLAIYCCSERGLVSICICFKDFSNSICCNRPAHMHCSILASSQSGLWDLFNQFSWNVDKRRCTDQFTGFLKVWRKVCMSNV